MDRKHSRMIEGQLYPFSSTRGADKVTVSGPSRRAVSRLTVLAY